MNRIAIICVDDEEVILHSLKSQLKICFNDLYEIEIANNGDEALELFDELIDDGYEVPVVISDQIMPGMKGDEFLTQIHLKDRRVRTILLTGEASPEAIGNAVNKAGLYRYLAKPWAKDDLQITINQAINSYFQEQKLNRSENLKDQLLQELKTLNETLEDKIAQRTNELEIQKRLLEIKNQDITASITYAKVIQESILPSQSDLDKHFASSFIYYRPKNIVSGDFYWLHPNIDDSVYLAVGDCTGHGVPGAFMSVLGTSLFNETCRLGQIKPTNEILDHVRSGIVQTLRQDEDGSHLDGIDASLILYKPSTKQLHFSGAHNGLFLIRNNDKPLLNYNQETILPFTIINQIHIFYIPGDLLPLSYHFDSSQNFEETILQIEEGDSIFLTTDGYLDQFGGDQNKKFMRRRFMELIADTYKLSGEEQRQLILKEFNIWMGSEDQTDDVCVIGINF